MSVQVKFGRGEWMVGSVYYKKEDIPLAIIIPAVIVPMLLFIAVSVYCYRFDTRLQESDGAFVFSACLVHLNVHLSVRRKSQQAEREYEKVKHQLDSLEESVRERCKKEFTGTNGHIFNAAKAADGAD